MQTLLKKIAKMSPGVISIESFPGDETQFEELLSQGHIRRVGNQGFMLKFSSFKKTKQ